jgi:hypothetical protein
VTQQAKHEHAIRTQVPHYSQVDLDVYPISILVYLGENLVDDVRRWFMWMINVKKNVDD